MNMKKAGSLLLAFLLLVSLCACGASEKEADSNALTEEEFERVQAIFTEYVGTDLEYEPEYCGEWREGKQYKTTNYAHGQYLINMDVDGYVHLVIWVEDGDRVVMYNRLEDEDAPSPVTPDDEGI